ncbi:MAG: hypothetical protein CVU41_12890 [Chloroflexi bacterium HGW-Chloroflexi-3]|nr:MAG: hypothetical protein CVU41_12890 [Chloroflexi bacterium HGW-Chloroflexi-3]
MIPVAGGVLFVLLAELLRAFFYDVNLVRQFPDGSVQMGHPDDLSAVGALVLDAEAGFKEENAQGSITEENISFLQ